MIFSVVIPVYNVKDYLPKCIDSVLAQDFEDYEVILIDDGSTDGESGAICDRYAAAHPERIRAIHKPNGGVGEARNVGIEAAQGEYLIFIDSDDYIAPDMFRVLADAVARFGSDIIGFGAALEANGGMEKAAAADAAAAEDVRYSIDERFEDEIESLNKKTDDYMITVGKTSDVLKSIGVKDQTILWNAGKIKEILKIMLIVNSLSTRNTDKPNFKPNKQKTMQS